jgi:hypothetical protein
MAAGTAVGGGVGSIPAATIGAVGGAVAGAGAGAVAGNELRIRIGRAIGTYKDTDEGHLTDNALEAMAAMTGQTLSLGARPTWNWFKGVMGKFGKTASEAVKDTTAAVLGGTTSAGAEATRLMMDHADDAGKLMVQLKSAGGRGADGIINAGAERQVGAAKQILEAATENLPKEYGKFLGTLFTQAETKGVSANIGEVVSAAQGEIANGGFGKILKGRLLPFTAEEIAERKVAGLPVDPLAMDKKIFGRISQVYNTLGAYSKIGKLEGKAAAETLTDINKTLNQVSRNFMSDPTAAAANRVVTAASAGFKNSVETIFKNAGMSAKYSEGAALYGKYGDAVANARGLLDNPKGIETFVNQYIKSATSAGKNLTVKGEMGLLSELAGKQDLAKDIVLTEVVKRFAPIGPKIGWFPAGYAGATAMGMAPSALGGAATAGVAAQFSPRIVGAEIRGASKAIGFMAPKAKQMGAYGDVVIQTLMKAPASVQTAILKDPQAQLLRGAFQTVGAAFNEEEKKKAELLKQAGVGQ